MVDLDGVEPELVPAAAEDGRREPLLQLQRHHLPPRAPPIDGLGQRRRSQYVCSVLYSSPLPWRPRLRRRIRGKKGMGNRAGPEPAQSRPDNYALVKTFLLFLFSFVSAGRANWFRVRLS